MIALWLILATPAADPAVTLREKPGRVEIVVGDAPFATYVHADAKIPRPYFTDLVAPGGGRVTRNHPPQSGDPTDHADFHPGLWMSFGVLGGADFWRNKATTEHVDFAVAPKDGRFTVRNRYVDKDRAVATETASYAVRVTPVGTLLVWDSTFAPVGDELVFGDQEEMGLGVRLATPLTVKKGGALTASGGGPTEKQVRGKQHTWCDYAGTADGQRLGVLLVPDPANAHPSWFHARDYGLLVANPFARKALGGGEPSRVVVRRGETLRLRFGVLVHGSPDGFDPAAAAKVFLTHLSGGAS